MEYVIYTVNDELYHDGVKGMRWGIRRWQNKDGSLTPAGKKRRAKLEAKLEKVTGKKKDSDAGDQPRKKTASEMTDDELDKAIVRARKEDEYRRLRPEPQPKESFAKRFINDAVKPAAVNAGKDFLEKTFKQAGANLFKGKVDPNSLEALKARYDKLDYKTKIDKILNPDKYLSEEDKTKRQNREYDAEDRAAKMLGYDNAAKKAAKDIEARRMGYKDDLDRQNTEYATKVAKDAQDAADKAAAEAKASRLAGAKEAMSNIARGSATNAFIDRVSPTRSTTADDVLRRSSRLSTDDIDLVGSGDTGRMFVDNHGNSVIRLNPPDSSDYSGPSFESKTIEFRPLKKKDDD